MTPNQRLAALVGAPPRPAVPGQVGREGEALVFMRTGRRWFALPVAAISEVATKGAVTRIPTAPRAILGLALVRGRMVPVVSLALLMGFSPVGEPAATLPRLAVLRAEDTEIAVVADEIRGVIDKVPAPPRAAGTAADHGVDGEADPAAEGAGQGVFLGEEVTWQGRVAPLIDVPALVRRLQRGPV